VEHVVFFPGPAGEPAFARLPSLEDALRLVERLRNIDGVADVSVHALTEVPLSFRAYYRVEVPVAVEPVAVEPVAEETVPAVEPVEPVEAAVEAAVEASVVVPAARTDADAEPAVEQSVEQPVGSNGHRDEGPRSLGYFVQRDA
jgi:hypothetical protein